MMTSSSKSSLPRPRMSATGFSPVSAWRRRSVGELRWTRQRGVEEVEGRALARAQHLVGVATGRERLLDGVELSLDGGPGRAVHLGLRARGAHGDLVLPRTPEEEALGALRPLLSRPIAPRSSDRCSPLLLALVLALRGERRTKARDQLVAPRHRRDLLAPRRSPASGAPWRGSGRRLAHLLGLGARRRRVAPGSSVARRPRARRPAPAS